MTAQGKQVLLIDERDQIGGAWSTVNHSNLPEIETGCHIWDVEKHAYHFLKHFFHLNLVELSPAPRILKGSSRLPYDWKMNALTAKQIAKRSLKLQFSDLKKDLKGPAYRISLLPAKYLYPQNGARDIKEALHKTVEDYQLSIRLNTKIESVTQGNLMQISLDDGTVIESDELVMTSLSSIGSLNIAGEAFKPETRRVDYIHMHLLIKDAKMKNFSYDRIMGNELIHRISDMSFQVMDSIESDQKLIAVGIFDKAYYEHEGTQLEQKITDQLKKLGYLSNASVCLESAVNIYPSYYNDRQLLEKIADLSNGGVRVMHSTNFTYGFSNYVDRWSPLLDTSSK